MGETFLIPTTTGPTQQVISFQSLGAIRREVVLVLYFSSAVHLLALLLFSQSVSLLSGFCLLYHVPNATEHWQEIGSVELSKI